MFSKILILLLLSFCMIYVNAQDNQLKKFAYRVHEYLADGSEIGGSGFFVSYSKKLFFVTARHLLYDTVESANGGRYWLGVINFNIESSINGKINQVASVSFANGHANVKAVLKAYRYNFDFATIEVPYKLIHKIILVADYADSAHIHSGMEVYTVGYPGFITSPRIYKSKLVTPICSVNNKMNVMMNIKDTCSAGTSGAPVFVKTNNKFSLIGICSGVDNDIMQEKFTNAIVLKKILNLNYH